MPNDMQLAVREIESNLSKSSEKFQQVLPAHVSPERLIRVALTAISKTPQLLDCRRETLYKAIMESAQLGLVTDGVLGEAYLVPYKSTCQLIVGYRGLIGLAMRSGKVSLVYAEVVHENDTFEYEMGAHPKLVHKPSLRDRGDVIGAYAVAHLISAPSQPAICFMPKEDIDSIRSRSRAKDSGPWVTDYNEMAKKTVVRRLCKSLPLSPDLMRAAAKGEYEEAGVLDVGPATAAEPGKSKFGFSKQKELQEAVEVSVEVVEPDGPERPADDAHPKSADDSPPKAEDEGSPAASTVPSRKEQAMSALREVMIEQNVTRDQAAAASVRLFGDAFASATKLSPEQIATLCDELSGPPEGAF